MNRSRARALFVSAILAVAAVGCFSDMGPTAISTPDVPESSGSLIGSGGLLGTLGSSVLSPLLACAPQPYAADTEVVGPAGGTLHIGPHRLVIPAGALDQAVRIFGDAPADTVVSVRFQPEGLQFNSTHPPRLTLDYSACGLVHNLLPKRIAYTNDQLGILSYLLSVDDLLHEQVSADLHHFSRYAVAW